MLDDERDWDEVNKDGTGGGGTGGASNEPPPHFDLYLHNHVTIAVPNWSVVVVVALLTMLALFGAFLVRDMADVVYYLSLIAVHTNPR